MIDKFEFLILQNIYANIKISSKKSEPSASQRHSTNFLTLPYSQVYDFSKRGDNRSPKYLSGGLTDLHILPYTLCSFVCPQQKVEGLSSQFQVEKKNWNFPLAQLLILPEETEQKIKQIS